jgi:hypothetical protein
MIETDPLKVTNVRYFETRRGVGYQCKTNHKDVEIWNDGNGGATYIELPKSNKLSVAYDTSSPYHHFKENDFMKLIDTFEGVESI